MSERRASRAQIENAARLLSRELRREAYDAPGDQGALASEMRQMATRVETVALLLRERRRAMPRGRKQGRQQR